MGCLPHKVPQHAFPDEPALQPTLLLGGKDFICLAQAHLLYIGAVKYLIIFNNTSSHTGSWQGWPSGLFMSTIKTLFVH